VHALLAVGWLQVVGRLIYWALWFWVKVGWLCRVWLDQLAINRLHNFQQANSYNCTHLTPKTASLVPPEGGELTPKACRGKLQNKGFLIVF
jgi:hypothetical protein